jgi:uncharacterized repeat protein (TIGR03803 family)
MRKSACSVLMLAIGLSACSHAALPNALPGASAIAPLIERAAEHYKTLFNFGLPNAERPVASLIDVKGTLYGTSTEGGKDPGAGTVFSITPAGKQHVLHSFLDTPDGADPVAGLTYFDGTFYGTTFAGGKYNYGTVFSMSLSGKLHILHSFAGAPNDGEQPEGSLAVLNGVLYGTTSDGGKIGYGIVFSITKAGKLRVIYSFNAASYGQSPASGLLVWDNVLYGTAGGGAYPNGGTVFSLTTGGAEKVLHSFGGPNDGEGPVSALTRVGNLLYGTTQRGGAFSNGIAFSVSRSGEEKVIHSFGSGTDGQVPAYSGDALAVHNGELYGTTELGGKSAMGTVFGISTAGKERVLYSFGAFPAGREPYGGVTPVKDTLFGTTSTGGSNYEGTAFALTPL